MGFEELADVAAAATLEKDCVGFADAAAVLPSVIAAKVFVATLGQSCPWQSEKYLPLLSCRLTMPAISKALLLHDSCHCHAEESDVKSNAQETNCADRILNAGRV